jgi:phosphoenolpyruvate carboxylase
LTEILEESEDALSILIRWYRHWVFFRTLIDNAQQELARARLPIARRYDELAEGSQYERIAEEFHRTRSVILRLTGQNELLDNNPVIQRSIDERNGPTDLLNLLQIELLKRFRAADGPEQQLFQAPLFSAINGIASAMQSTG